MAGLTKEQVEKFHEQGFLVVENFLGDNELQRMKEESHRLVEEANIIQNPTVIQTGEALLGTKYFLESGQKISFFFEENALDKNGKIIANKERALNKLAHAVHWLSPVFKKITFSDKMKAVARSLNYVDPVVIQGMYIFKHPLVAGKVREHQDATYLHTEPISCVGFWLPTEDATLENGCLHFIPESHKGPLRKRMVRNPDKTGTILIHTAPNSIYEGAGEFVAVPVKKGSLVLIHGLVIHKSGINTTEISREVYTFHMVESHNTKYSDDNWCLPTKDFPFPSLYRTVV